MFLTIVLPEIQLLLDNQDVLLQSVQALGLLFLASASAGKWSHLSIENTQLASHTVSQAKAWKVSVYGQPDHVLPLRAKPG